jgi:hypothetical protein
LYLEIHYIQIFSKMCKWSQFGKRAGYPECCIKAFIERNDDDNNIIPPNRIQLKVSKESGFIPCSYCAWKVLSKQCTLEELLIHRKSRKPFPIDDFVDYKDMCE